MLKTVVIYTNVAWFYETCLLLQVIPLSGLESRRNYSFYSFVRRLQFCEPCFNRYTCKRTVVEAKYFIFTKETKVWKDIRYIYSCLKLLLIDQILENSKLSRSNSFGRSLEFPERNRDSWLNAWLSRVRLHLRTPHWTCTRTRTRKYHIHNVHEARLMICLRFCRGNDTPVVRCLSVVVVYFTSKLCKSRSVTQVVQYETHPETVCDYDLLIII